MIIFDYLGEPKTHQKIVPGNTVTSISANVYNYRETKVAYTSGGTYVMAVGDTVVGATSSATAIITERTITSGTDAAGTAAGVLTLKCQVGTFQSENLNVEGNSNVATIAGDTSANINYVGLSAKALLVSVEDNSANFCMDGTLPSQTNKYGHKLASSQSYVISDPNAMRNLKFIDSVSGSASVIKITGFF